MERGEIQRKGRTYCVAGAPNDVSYKNNTHIPSISIHHFPKDVAVWPKWTRFDRCHRGDFTLQSHWPYAPYRLRRRLLLTHTTSQIRGRYPMNSAKKKGTCSHTEHDWFFSAGISQAKNGKLLVVVYFTRYRCTYVPCLPHNYICTFLIVWKSNQFLFPSCFSNRIISFVIKFKPFPELTDILLREQCKTSGGCWHKHKLEAAVHSPNLGFRKSIPRAIISPCS